MQVKTNWPIHSSFPILSPQFLCQSVWLARSSLQRSGGCDGKPAGGIHTDQAPALRVAECSLQQRSHGEHTRLASLQTHLVVITKHPPPTSLLSSPNPPLFTFWPFCCPALRSSYEEEEADLPKLEDLQGAAMGLMRLQDVYALQVASLARGRFQRVTNGKPIDVCIPAVSVSLSGDDCFLVGKVRHALLSFIKQGSVMRVLKELCHLSVK